jgi:hypothetical protein
MLLKQAFLLMLFSQQIKVAIEKLQPRTLIPNDSKLFAQVDLDISITHFVTSDARSQKTLKALKSTIAAKFKIIDIATPYHEIYGVLDL